MHFPILFDLFIIFSLALVVNLLFQRLRMPSILGFIAAGVLAGPHFFALDIAVNDLELLSEIGIMLLLFTIGIELSIKDLMQIRKIVFIGGGFQVFVTALVVFAITFWLGYQWQLSLFFGFLVALSSTAIVLKVMQEQSMMNQPYGKGSLGILIFQDLIVVPMIVLIPFLTGGMEDPGIELFWMLVKVLGLVVFTILGSRYIVPKVLHAVARTQKQDFFILIVFIIGFGIAILSASLGLSLALGAFLAGLIISETDYNHEAFGNIVPFRDIFTSFFFITIGMFLNISFLFDNIVLVLILTSVVFVLKTVVTSVAVWTAGQRVGVAVTMGVALSQVGEFSILLAQTGMQYNLMTDHYHQVFLNVAVLSMVLAPFIIKYAPRMMEKLIPEWIYNLRIKHQPEKEIPVHYDQYKNHLVIVGMGVNGHNMAHAAEYAGLKHVIIDNDADLVQREKKNGEPIIFGNAENMAVLKEAGVQHAGTVVIAIRNPSSTYTALRNTRHLNKNAFVIVRTRYVEDLEHLYKAGANDVIPESFETAVEIFSRVLSHNLVPDDEVRKMAAKVRENGYGIFREHIYEKEQPFVPNFTISAVRVSKNAEVLGKSLRELRASGVFDQPVLAVQRGEEVLINPSDEIVLEQNDILVVMAKPEDLACKTCVFEPEDATALTADSIGG
ncbi:MAG: cation:proton antiporter [Salinivirgaceae bacterium]